MDDPFPGVDPYIESQNYWPDFHARFITSGCDALADRLPEHYEARIDEQFRLVEAPGPPRAIEPDVAVLRAGPASADRREAEAGVAVLEPVTIPIPMTLRPRRKERRIEVRRLPERSLVAVIEVLSPTNEAQGFDEYLAKRLAVHGQDVHLIELDLLLSGHRLPMMEPLPPGDFYAFVARADRRPDCDVYAWSIRRALPPIPVPLRAPDPDVTLDLAAVYATAHARGRYARSLDYSAPLPLPRAPDDRAWAESLARAAHAATRPR